MTEKKQPVCVVVPVYRLPLAEGERLALAQCTRVLRRHPLCLVKPESLDVRALLAEFPAFSVQSFPDEFFRSVEAYSRLMLWPGFCERFTAYEYILIHQADVFVFADELDAWCAKGYDYIGAPWVNAAILTSPLAVAYYRAKRWLYDALERRSSGGYRVHPVRNLFRVGNGGLSLRRVSAWRALVERHKAFIDAALAETPRPVNEDELVCSIINRDGRELRVPDWREAAHFAIELLPRLTVETLLDGRLPFGVHAWEKYEPEFWRPRIVAAAGSGASK